MDFILRNNVFEGEKGWMIRSVSKCAGIAVTG